ncbi:MAG TPA: cob(I)yrinic acid a,c-diamide adenosyltransferase [Euryarchaeota archaeon]|nr:MAG: cob(I)yrinic acid a,c-diamide adenosyltransferase [Thermoplasmatales archaeon ex4484_6]RLF66547.1 MAG: cob(I)yrinic acid a,c-diamide adenosyltransferase [Thermoplasmata archaeon]HHD15415.1 cob(I)yrinic acid a,c-diamide adenosyltransferase [Euryarchaeota archaeon]
MSFEKGYVQVYTGNGKGKTTSSIGLGLRAAGSGLRVHMIQFMKGRRYSELDALEHVPGFTVEQHGRDEFVSKEKPEKIDVELAGKGLSRARKVVLSGEYDLVILDEVNVAVDFGLITEESVLELIRSKPAHVELVLTGRYATEGIIEAADLVTEMREIKHFYNSGVEARKGIEY